MATISDDAAGAVEDFASGIKRLLADLARRVPHDATVRSVQRQVSLAYELAPVDLLTVAGPFLYKYRAVINSASPATARAFFEPSVTFGEEVAATAPDRRELAACLIPKVQEVARGLSPAEQNEYIAAVQELLDCYVVYLDETLNPR